MSNKTKHVVLITEFLNKAVEVYAENENEAKHKVMELYGNGDIVLTADDFGGCIDYQNDDTLEPDPGHTADETEKMFREN